jgi:hypothetical protein
MALISFARVLSTKRVLLPCLLILTSIACIGQEVTPPIPDRIVLHSAVLAEDRPVFVRLPLSYADGNTKYPILILD